MKLKVQSIFGSGSGRKLNISYHIIQWSMPGIAFECPVNMADNNVSRFGIVNQQI